MRHRKNLTQTNDSNSLLPRIGITIGDAAGIGPEVTLKSLEDKQIIDQCRPLLIGDRAVIERIATEIGSSLGFASIGEAKGRDGVIEVCDAGILREPFKVGVESAATGRAAGECIVKAVELWRSRDIDAITTASISKASLKLGGFDFPGHTEFLAALTDTSEFAMSFVAGNLRVVLLSTHLSLIEAARRVTRENLERLIRFCSRELGQLLRRSVKIAVAALNPHASENGLFGSEEANEMIPAIENCVRDNIDVTGPHSADTVFLRGFRGEFDGVIACYHDQATIAVKCLSFGAA
ncbi:MAG: PdxA family protein, partial [Pyrinomonadaceae bacterium]